MEYQTDIFVEQSYLGFPDNEDEYVEDRIDYPTLTVEQAFKFNLIDHVKLQLSGAHSILDRICTWDIHSISLFTYKEKQSYRVTLGSAKGISNYELAYGGAIVLAPDHKIEVFCKTSTEKVLWGIYLQQQDRISELLAELNELKRKGRA